MIFLTVLALSFQLVGPYLIWPSRWNVPAHINLGFCVTAYIIPGLFTNVWAEVSSETVQAYAQMNIIGAIALMFGLLIGSRSGIKFGLYNRLSSLFDGRTSIVQSMRRAQTIALLAVVGMVAAYAVMGFVPMFAEDPLTAKQFKGVYFEQYYRAAYLFRLSFSLLLATLPIILTVWWVTRRWKPLILGVSAIGLITVSLARASSVMGLITFLGFISARTARATRWYLVLVAIIFPLGSAGYLVLGILTGVEALTSIYSLDSVFDIVASGAPDIFDQLVFLNDFLALNTFTYGRTFFGGLVPGNYMWNPSVWTLTYNNLGADISETVSGGLRLSVALWGYANFGWVGVVMIPLVSGFITGAFIAMLRRLPLNKSLIGAALALMIYLTLGKQLSDFYFLSIHNIPAIVCVWFICFGLRGRRAVRLAANTNGDYR